MHMYTHLQYNVLWGQVNFQHPPLNQCFLSVCTALPQIAALPETKEVTIGSDAVLPCVASGYPVPDIKWSKVTYIFVCLEIIYINFKVCRSYLA